MIDLSGYDLEQLKQQKADWVAEAIDSGVFEKIHKCVVAQGHHYDLRYRHGDSVQVWEVPHPEFGLLGQVVRCIERMSMGVFDPGFEKFNVTVTLSVFVGKKLPQVEEGTYSIGYYEDDIPWAGDMVALRVEHWLTRKTFAEMEHFYSDHADFLFIPGRWVDVIDPVYKKIEAFLAIENQRAEDIERRILLSQLLNGKTV